MTYPFQAWAMRHGVSQAALADLVRELTVATPSAPNAEPHSEDWVQAQVRLEAARAGVGLWRNNVGALRDENGRMVRYGLANDSKQVNEVIKSADLIGCRPVVITQAHVGHTIGQFVSREIKRGDWKWTGSKREHAQARWATLVTKLGGDAKIVNCTGTL